MEYDCAFCGETNEVFVDASAGRRQAVDDDGEVELSVTQEYEA